MIVLLSPAKRLEETRPPPVEATEPRFQAQARTIARAAKRLKPADLGALMHISPALADLNAGRFKSFGRSPGRPAAFTFAGDVYRGLDAWSLDDTAMAFAQAHLRILSGLYGWLRPLDRIEPYRLEMGVGFAVGAAPTLVDYWRPKLTRALHEAAGDGPVVNLASVEYFAPLKAARLAGGVIDVRFLAGSPNGAPRFESFAAKHARGAMARWICEMGIDRRGDLDGFDRDGYALDRAASADRQLVFVRRKDHRAGLS